MSADATKLLVYLNSHPLEADHRVWVLAVTLGRDMADARDREYVRELLDRMVRENCIVLRYLDGLGTVADLTA